MYTAEGYRDKFHSGRPEAKETAKQYASWFVGYFYHWLELPETEGSFSGPRELMIAEQFVKSCSPALRVFLKEQSCRTLHKLFQTADNFVEAQLQLNLSKERSEKEDKPGSGFRAEPTNKTSRACNRCFLCDKRGHGAGKCCLQTKGSFTGHGRNDMTCCL